jgi:hypothetical protein
MQQNSSKALEQCGYIHTYIYIYIYTHTHTHIYTHRELEACNKIRERLQNNVDELRAMVDDQRAEADSLREELSRALGKVK